jgi:hypothetical protein
VDGPVNPWDDRRVRRERIVLGLVAATLAGAAAPVLAGGGSERRPAPAVAPPPAIGPDACPDAPRRLGPDAVAKAAEAALSAERAEDRPRLVSSVLADHGATRNAMVRRACGRRAWRRTVVVEIDLRAFRPSASLSQRVSFVAHTAAGYEVYALGH